MGFLRCFTQPSPHESVLVTRDCALSSMKDYLGETYGGEPDVQPEASVFFCSVEQATNELHELAYYCLRVKY